MTGSGDTIVVADVGNTRIKLAVVAEAGNGAGRALPTVTSRQDLLSREFRAANLEAWLGRVAPGATVILVASVHDAAAARLEAAVAEVAVTRHCPLPCVNLTVLPEMVQGPVSVNDAGDPDAVVAV